MSDTVLGDPAAASTGSLRVERWQAPVVGLNRQATDRMPLDQATPERLAQLKAEAREEGYRRGLEEGRAAGQAERSRQAERLAALADALVPQARLQDEALLAQIGALIVAAVRQFVRRELSLQPGEVVRVIREAVAVLPARDAVMNLHLHPEDAALVNQVLDANLFDRPWRVHEDLTISRGGVRVETAVSTVDATVESRMNALLAQLIGDQRDAAHE